jgi:carbon monoxide dehydrogenase subunit G
MSLSAARPLRGVQYGRATIALRTPLEDVAMIQFEGDRDFAVLPPLLSEKLSDARFLVKCIPDVQSVSKAEASEAVCTIRPGFAFVRGTVVLTIRVAESVPGQSVKLVLLSKGMGNSSTVEALLTLTPRETGSRVHWQATITEMGGLLKLVPQGLIRGAAQKVIGDAWNAVETQLPLQARSASEG